MTGGGVRATFLATEIRQKQHSDLVKTFNHIVIRACSILLSLIALTVPQFHQFRHGSAGAASSALPSTSCTVSHVYPEDAFLALADFADLVHKARAHEFALQRANPTTMAPSCSSQPQLCGLLATGISARSFDAKRGCLQDSASTMSHSLAQVSLTWHRSSPWSQTEMDTTHG